MATAPVGIAPVFTPQTFERLAQMAERSTNAELASSLREQVPFVLGMVEKFFRPLTRIENQKQFNERFLEYALLFEPFRLYLNQRVLESLAGQDPFQFYTKVLNEVVAPLVTKAESAGFSSELLEAILHDYIFVLKTAALSGLAPTSEKSFFAQFESSVEWMHSATRLDFGLTAIFLALEGTLGFSKTKIRLALMVASKAAVLDLASTTSSFFNISADFFSPDKLDSTRVGLMPSRAGYIRERRRIPPLKKATTSRRAVEIDWLKKNLGAAVEHRGKWIVLENDELVASDSDYKRARDTATRRGIKRPFIIFVPPSGNGGFMGV